MSYFRVEDNFGFITVENFLSFLEETGLSMKKHAKDIALFLDACFNDSNATLNKEIFKEEEEANQSPVFLDNYKKKILSVYQL